MIYRILNLNQTTKHWNPQRVSTGSGSDLVLARAVLPKKPGRYRSPYCTNSERACANPQDSVSEVRQAGRLRSQGFIALLLLLALSTTIKAQETRTGSPPKAPESAPSSPASSPPNVLASPDEDYRIGAGDVIEITVDDAPEISVGSKRVSANGTILMPYLKRIVAQGKTPEELEKIVADGLRGRYLKNPQVRVSVKQYNSRSFFIQGAVRTPGVYQMEGKPTLLKLITISGGLQENHGSTAFIIREVKDKPNLPAASVDEAGNEAKIAKTEAESAGSRSRQITAPAEQSKPSTPAADAVDGAKYEMIQANISGLLRGNFAQNVVVEPGDIVHIPQRDVFFVAGEVHAPGQFLLKDGTTLRQAISLAQGTTVKAAQKEGRIFREDANGKRVEIKIDIGAVMDGKHEDMMISANDIIVVPNSRLKTVGTTLLSAFGASAITRMPIR